MNQIPSMLQYILAQQGRQQPSEDELALLAASQGEQPPMMIAAADKPQEDKRSLLQRLFGRPVQPQPQPGERKADELVAPGSLGDQLRQRRLEQERMLKEQAGIQPEDMLMAQNSDPYGGVSVQTRAAMNQLGKDVGGDMGDLVVGGQGSAQGSTVGAPSGQSVRGKQTPKQEDQLIKMLMNRGMSEKEARMRARSVI